MRNNFVFPSRLPSDIRQNMIDVVTKSNSNYYWAMRLQSQERRESIFSIYAFCRVIDDLIDGPTPKDLKQKSLDKWRQRINLLYEGKSDHPLTLSLGISIEKYDLPKQNFEDFLDGMQMDLDDLMRAPFQSILEHYCWRTAGSIGELCLKVFDVKHKQSRDLARELGKAMQITNILRDLDEDAKRDRLYIPHEDLDAVGISFLDPQQVLQHPHIMHARNQLAYRAEQAFQTSENLIKDFPYRPMRPVWIMMSIYHRLLSKMQKSRWTQKPKVNTFEKISIATKHFALQFLLEAKKIAKLS